MAVRLSPRRSSIYFIDKNFFAILLTNSNRKNQTQRPDARVNTGIISDLAFAQKQRNSERTAGLSLLFDRRDNLNRRPAARQRSAFQRSDKPPAADTSLCPCGIAAIPLGCRRCRPLSQCHQAQDTLEAFPLGGGNARARSQVIVDDFDLLPAQRTHPFGHGILEKLALLILSYLFFAGLPQVDNRLASQVLRFDFGIVQDLCHCRFPAPRERPLPERGP